MNDGMKDLQVLQRAAPVLVQRIMRGARVGEFRFRADRRHDLGCQERITTAGIDEGGIGVPEPVAHVVHPAAVVRIHHCAALVDVADVAVSVVAMAILADRRSRGGPMDLAVEALGERELLGEVESLVAEDQHGVLVHAGPDLLQDRRIMRVLEFHAAGFGGVQGVQLAKLQFHGSTVDRMVRHVRTGRCCCPLHSKVRSIALHATERARSALRPLAAPSHRRTIATSGRAPARPAPGSRRWRSRSRGPHLPLERTPRPPPQSASAKRA